MRTKRNRPAGNGAASNKHTDTAEFTATGRQMLVGAQAVG